jgi:hypothetical protein
MSTATGHQRTQLRRRRYRHGLQPHRVRTHKPAGARSTHPTWSPWSALARGSRTASSSNDPTNQEAIIKPRDEGGHETGRDVGQRKLPVTFGCLTRWGAWMDSAMQGGPVDELRCRGAIGASGK